MDISIIGAAVLQGLMLGGVYGLVGLGITMVYAVTGLLNFAHGDFMSLTMYICLALFGAIALDPYISLLITLPVMFGIGIVIYLFLFRRVLEAEVLMVVQMTLGLSFIISNGISMIYTADFQSVSNVLMQTIISIGPMRIRATYLVCLLAGAGVGFGLYWMLQSTDLGRQVRAIAQDREAAQLMGVNVGRVQMIIFALGITLLGLVGPLTTSIITMEPYMGIGLTLFAFIIFVMGGIGNFLGTLVAGYILGVAEALGMLLIGGWYGAMVPYALFVIILLVRPQGVMGSR